MITVRLYYQEAFIGHLTVEDRRDIRSALDHIRQGEGSPEPASPIQPAQPAAVLRVNALGYLTLYLNNLDHRNTAAFLNQSMWKAHTVKPLFTNFTYEESGTYHITRCETDGELFHALSQTVGFIRSPTLQRRDAQQNLLRLISPQLIGRQSI